MLGAAGLGHRTVARGRGIYAQRGEKGGQGGQRRGRAEALTSQGSGWKQQAAGDRHSPGACGIQPHVLWEEVICNLPWAKAHGPQASSRMSRFPAWAGGWKWQFVDPNYPRLDPHPLAFGRTLAQALGTPGWQRMPCDTPTLLSKPRRGALNTWHEEHQLTTLSIKFWSVNFPRAGPGGLLTPRPLTVSRGPGILIGQAFRELPRAPSSQAFPRGSP